MVWAVIILGTIFVALVFFEWRSRNKPLSRGLEGNPSHWSGSAYPPGTHGDLNKPHD
jgi:hypothetical protein